MVTGINIAKLPHIDLLIIGMKGKLRGIVPVMVTVDGTEEIIRKIIIGVEINTNNKCINGIKKKRLGLKGEIM